MMRTPPAPITARLSPRFACTLAALLLAASARAASPTTPADDIAVSVQKNGEEIVVHVDCPVRAPHAAVWEVLTDYDHMARYVTNLKVSELRGRDRDPLQVLQRRRALRGLPAVRLATLREIHHLP